MDTETIRRLDDLLNYVHHVGMLDQKPMFKIDEYGQLAIWEHQFKGRIGIQHNLTDPDGIPIWLQIERLKRIAPPEIPKQIQEWISVSNDPEHYPQIKDKLIKTIHEDEAQKLLDKGLVRENDIHDSLKHQGTEVKFKDVIFCLNNNVEVKNKVDNYLNEQWVLWAEEEKPRRKTIKIYDSLFSLQQTIEAHGDEQPIELIWGIGISRWICEGHKIDHPLIEKPVEIEVNRENGAILIHPRIHPRNFKPTIAVGSFSALENPGVDTLLRFTKKHFSELSEDVEFSPYIRESFESILRQASTCLSEKGAYWPDINQDQGNREPNKAGDTLEITDSWVVFVRPRSTTGFVQDIERFQEKFRKSKDNIPNPVKRLITKLSDKKPLSTGSGILSEGESSSSSISNKPNAELFFPKPYNDAQLQIVDRLEHNDGVVVQGPPGTGKTHTIANIICHYLAKGRSVLVTSKGEPALSVLQGQIPEELRPLTISLLANEKQGMKQLESAVQLLAGVVSQTNLRELNQEAESSELRIKQLKKEIQTIDSKMRDWVLKQLNPIDIELSGTDTKITAMELAYQVINDTGNHEWLQDELGSSDKYNPQFSDSDIANIRIARKKLGEDIIYVGKRLPNQQDMVDTANIVAIHDDLATSARIAEESKKNHVPPLAVSVEKSIDRAKKLICPLKELFKLLGQIEESRWIGKIFYSWITMELNDNTELFNDLKCELSDLTKQRQTFVKILVEVNDPSLCNEQITIALNNLIAEKRPFGLLSFGNKEAKKNIEQIRIGGETPQNTKQWQLALDYIIFQEDIRKFIIKWNHVGQELDLPELSYSYGGLFKDGQSIYDLISKAEKIAQDWNYTKKEILELFPHGINVGKLPKSKSEITKTIEAIKLNTSRISLGVQRLKLQDLTDKLKHSDGNISGEIRNCIENIIGNPSYSSDEVMKEWQGLIAELNRLNNLSIYLHNIEDISEKISSSGAPNWSEQLKTSPILATGYELTPVDWYESWQWKRRTQYLREIDGREELKKISDKRSLLDNDLQRTFSDLVRIKTNIGLHKNMSDLAKSALMRFMSAMFKMPKTKTAKTLPFYRRQAQKAMEDCYGSVPCWIMPTWRVSESLPSDFGAFDLVIIDEASQSDITALPAIMRAKKLLIVGDDKQVSPTASFISLNTLIQLKDNFLREQPFAELLLPGVSIYDLANAVFPGQRIMLTEHFRCVEPIIRFSMQFYSEQLIPLRIPKSSEKLTPPLIDVFVKGGHRDERKKVNEVEAEAIVSEIKKIVSDPKYNGRSIGIVSLIGAQQTKFIQEQLLIELGEDIYQNYQIACGDAATFQGKERDIMFLSMVVGAGQGAVMNKRDAEQRMNVALSRARDRMYLFRSVEESNLGNESDLRLKILQHFVNPMPQRDNIENPIDLCDSGFERDVLTKLIEKGYNVTPQVKVGAFSIDMVVEGENDRRLAIELDGDKYHPPKKWMNDWQRQRVMERVGWKFWRCWGSSYTIDPDGCIDDLLNTLNRMGIQPCESVTGANIYTEYRVYETEIEPQIDGLDFELVVN